ncbi:MAG: hypothetical protein FJ010_06450 [Chloroflexi bacterium]|nr:hypothetical protein [Chloroflexota bacterium]
MKTLEQAAVIVSWIAWLSACALPGLGTGIPPGTETPQTQAAVTPTQVVAVLEADTISAADSPLPTPAPDPLIFDFPDLEPAPISAWRPPLYDIPWAPTPYDHFYFTRPIAADEVNWPAADYRYGGVFFEGEVHTGVDIPAPPGTPVLAAADGKVIWAGYGLYRGVPGDRTDPYGLAVMIRHDFGYQGKRLYTVYGHLAEVIAPRGQYVAAGDTVGLVGDTGRVTGPHLHMEVRWGELDFFHSMNPELWLAPPQGWGVLVTRLLRTGGGNLFEHDVSITAIYTGQVWHARTYADGAVNKDPYYQENLVVSDLPAGLYEISTSYIGKRYTTEIEIYPGRVSFLAFRGRDGFDFDFPAAPGEDFSPVAVP